MSRREGGKITQNHNTEYDITETNNLYKNINYVRNCKRSSSKEHRCANSVGRSNILPKKYDRLAFPIKLHNMLSDSEREGNEHIFSWLPNGTLFRIHNPPAFVEKILPKYYHRLKYRSFLRQLNLYGFQRIETKEPKEEFGAYGHESFLRDKPELCCLIKRPSTVLGYKANGSKAKKRTSKKQMIAMQSRPEQEEEISLGKDNEEEQQDSRLRIDYYTNYTYRVVPLTRSQEQAPCLPAMVSSPSSSSPTFLIPPLDINPIYHYDGNYAEEEEEQPLPQLLSTHPSHEQRDYDHINDTSRRQASDNDDDSNRRNNNNISSNKEHDSFLPFLISRQMSSYLTSPSPLPASHCRPSLSFECDAFDASFTCVGEHEEEIVCHSECHRHQFLEMLNCFNSIYSVLDSTILDVRTIECFLEQLEPTPIRERKSEQ